MLLVAWMVFQKTLMITAFVAAMMVAIEYANVQSHGLFMHGLGKSKWRQYLMAVVLGALPGCLGAYVLVSLFTHQSITLGAVVAGMIATSGDEMFVMLARIPQTAILMTLGLMVVGIGAAWLTDKIWPNAEAHPPPGDDGFSIHEEESCDCLEPETIRMQWKKPSFARIVLTLSSLFFLALLVLGWVGPGEWNWKRWTFSLISLFVLFIVATVPDHFLESHLWKHVAKIHVPRIFLWTLGTLALLEVIGKYVDIHTVISENQYLILLAAVLIGIIPESGPHLFFVGLFAEGLMPLSILMASSASQDGHGMLPLLAHSRVDFLRVKAINITVAFALGSVMLSMGF